VLDPLIETESKTVSATVSFDAIPGSIKPATPLLEVKEEETDQVQ